MCSSDLVKEVRYHQQHSADWVVRLGDGTIESQRRMQNALDELWPYTAELFEDDAIDIHAQTTGLGPRWSQLRAPWLAVMQKLLDEAQLLRPQETPFRSTGKIGRHSEHMGFILTQMQFLQRNYPGGQW